MREKAVQTARAFDLQAFRGNLAFADAVVCAAIGTDDLHSVLTESGHNGTRARCGFTHGNLNQSIGQFTTDLDLHRHEKTWFQIGQISCDIQR
jgi:hypothetical protein